MQKFWNLGTKFQNIFGSDYKIFPEQKETILKSYLTNKELIILIPKTHKHLLLQPSDVRIFQFWRSKNFQIKSGSETKMFVLQDF